MAVMPKRVGLHALKFHQMQTVNINNPEHASIGFLCGLQVCPYQ